MVEKDEQGEELSLEKHIILFIGPEGSGKSTVAERLAGEFGMPYITTGGILRDLAKNDKGSLGDACRKMFNENAYLAGETLTKILVGRFGQEDTEGGLVLDGGLRTLEETEVFQAMLEEAGRTFPLIIVYLYIPRKMSFERLVEGNDARKRDGDTHVGVATRLGEFMLNFEERLDHIEKEPTWSLLEVDGDLPKDEVYSSVVTAISGALE